MTERYFCVGLFLLSSADCGSVLRLKCSSAAVQRHSLGRLRSDWDIWIFQQRKLCLHRLCHEPCVCSSADSGGTEAVGAVVCWKAAAEERDVCLGVACVFRCLCEGWGHRHNLGLGVEGGRPRRLRLPVNKHNSRPHRLLRRRSRCHRCVCSVRWTRREIKWGTRWKQCDVEKDTSAFIASSP